MKTANDWYKEGVNANRESRYQDAVTCFDEVLKLNPHYKEALNAKGSVLYSQGNHEEAMRYYDLAIQADQYYTSPWNSKAMLFRYLKRYPEALECHERALAIDPNNKTALEGKKIILDELKEKDKPLTASTSSIRASMQRAAQSARQKYLGLLEKDYHELLLKYQKVGRTNFEEQRREQQQKFDFHLKELESDLQQQNRSQQKVFQENFQAVLDAHLVKSRTSVSEETFTQIQNELRSKLGQNFTQSIEKLLASQQYQDEIQRLQQNILQKIHERQSQMVFEVMHLQEDQKQLKDEHNPLFQEYQQKQQVLQEQEELQRNYGVKIFYNTIEKVLGSRLMSAMSLASGMIKREDSTIERGFDLTGNIVGKVLDCIPAIGTIAKTIATGAIEIGGTAAGVYQNRKHEKSYKNAVDSFIRLDDALLVAEIVARRLAQSYHTYIVEQALSSEDAEAAGENAANIVYSCIKGGELNSLEDKSLEIKIDYLIKKVQEEAQKQHHGFFKKTTVFKEPVLSKADKKQIATVTEDIKSLQQKNEFKEKQAQLEIARLKKEQDEMRAEFAKIKVIHEQQFFNRSPSPLPQRIFSLKEENQWAEATSRIKRSGNEILKLPLEHIHITQTEKNLMITIEPQYKTLDKMLEELGEMLQKLFGKEDIDNIDVENSTLKISLPTTLTAKKLHQFLQQTFKEPEQVKTATIPMQS